MTRVWVEYPGDTGSTVWGCDGCQAGAWCRTRVDAINEATAHARGHRVDVTLLDRPRGPQPNARRDAKIQRMRHAGETVRAIALKVGMSHAGVVKALRRMQDSA